MKSIASRLLRELRRLAHATQLRVETGVLAVTRFSVRRARLVILAVAVVSVALGLLALRLDPSGGIGQLLDHGSRDGKATARYHRQFGDEPITILVRARRNTAACGASCHLPDILLTPDLLRIVGLEGCLSGNVPRGGKPQAPPCGGLAKSKPIEFVLGPGTFINESARQVAGLFQAQLGQKAVQERKAEEAARKVAAARGYSVADQERLAQQARQLVDLQFQRKSIELGLRYGLTTTPALNNTEFVLKLVFEPALGAAVPKPRFAYLFPNDHSALIQARLRSGLSAKQREAAIALVQRAVSSPRFRLDRGEYIVSGLPLVTKDVASSVPRALWRSLIAVIVLVAAALALVFRSRPRLLPLFPALAAAALTFGAMSLLGASLTIGTVAVLPILVGLGAGHAVLLQARYRNALVERQGSDEARQEAATRALLATAIAAGVTATGFLVTLLSPTPMVRSFAAFTALGLGFSLACASTAGVAALAGRSRGWRMPSLPGRALLARLWRRLGSIRAPRRLKSLARASLDTALRRPGRVLGIALVIAVVGWAAGSQVSVESDISRLASPGGQQTKDAKALERETRSSGDVNVVVTANDLTSPAVIAWMNDYQKRVLSRHGYSDKRSCRFADLCPGLSLTNLLGTASGQRPAQIRAAFAGLPRYFSRSVISRDRRTAAMSFGIRAMSADRQKDVVRDMRAELNPPAGVRAELAGISVMAADSSSDLSSSRLVLTLVALAVVFLALLAVLRRASTSLASLMTLTMAVGWAGLVRFALDVPVNPLSAALGALLVAVLGQFTLALSARYLERRAAGLTGGEALRGAYVGAAETVVAPAAAAVAGFLALAASDVPELRDFGVLGAVDLVVCLIGLMVVLPAACAWLEERRPVRLPRSRAEAAAMARGVAASALAAGSKTVRWSRSAARRGLRAVGIAAATLARRVRAPRRRDEAQRP